MKNFFNKDEQTIHLAILACQAKSKEFSESNALTNQERKCLNKIEEWTEKFSQLVFDRFGAPYQRKLLATLDSNELLIVGKYAPQQNAITMAVHADIEPMFKKVQGSYCLNCNGKNHLDCSMYAFGVTLEIDSNPTESNVCPFWDKEICDRFDETDLDLGDLND